jgi:hypothetical protein
MAKAKKKKAVKNHLSTHESFQFALHVAMLAVLIGVFVMLMGQMGLSQDSRTKAVSPQMSNN